MPEGSLRECRGEWGFPSLQPQPHFSKWGLYLPLLLSQASRAGVGLARPGFPDAWLWLQFPGCLVHRAQLRSLLDLGAPSSMGFKAPGSLGLPCLPDTLGPLSLCLLGPCLSESVSSPQFSLSLCSLKWGNADKSANPHYTLRSPFPTFFMLWSGLGEARGRGVPSTLLRTGTCVVDLLTPTPNSSYLGLDIFLLLNLSLLT